MAIDNEYVQDFLNVSRMVKSERILEDYIIEGNEKNSEFIIPELEPIHSAPYKLRDNERINRSGISMSVESRTDLNQSDGESVCHIPMEFENNIKMEENDCYVSAEDEPEVEIDEITSKQELVEVELDPSLLLFVQRDKISNKKQSVHKDIQNIDHHLGTDKDSFSSSLLSTANAQTLLPSLKTLKQKSNTVASALRQAKRRRSPRKREPLEPLNVIDSSTENVTREVNNRNFDLEKSKLGSCRSDTESDVYCGPLSPCYSDVEEDQQSHAREHMQNLLEDSSGEEQNNGSNIQKCVDNVASKKYNTRKYKRKALNTSRGYLDKKRAIEINEKCQKRFLEKEENKLEPEFKKVNKMSRKTDSVNEIEKKGQRKELIEVEQKFPIFSEEKIDYTVFNENVQKKPKRERKRDRGPKELTALVKPESYECLQCGRKFKEKSHLATHSRAHIDVRNFKCNKCGSLFKTKTNLFFHIKTHSDAPFTCEKCNKTYPIRRMLMRHIRVVHRFENRFSCDQCGRKFTSIKNLNLHYTLHTGIKPFTCSKCDKSFVYKSTHVAHMKSHEKDASFNCELCPKDNDSGHESRKSCRHHSEARPWLCTVCGKGYPLKGTLKNHMKTHEPEKPFKCTNCAKSFMKKQSLELHLKIHAGESPQYMCDQCSQTYFTVFALKRHYLKHTSERNFICEVCNKSFWMKDALKVHLRSHSHIKLFPCTKCQKSFAYKHTLVAHLRTHLDVQPYSCTVCQKTFIHKYSLLRHERQHDLSTEELCKDFSPTSPPVPILGNLITSQLNQPNPLSIMMLMSPSLPPSPIATMIPI